MKKNLATFVIAGSVALSALGLSSCSTIGCDNNLQYLGNGTIANKNEQLEDMGYVLGVGELYSINGIKFNSKDKYVDTLIGVFNGNYQVTNVNKNGNTLSWNCQGSKVPIYSIDPEKIYEVVRAADTNNDKKVSLQEAASLACNIFRDTYNSGSK